MNQVRIDRFAIVMFSIVVAFSLASTCLPMSEDNGMLVVDGVAVVPEAIPVCVQEDGYAMEHRGDVGELIGAACEQWNDWLGFRVFEHAICIGRHTSVSFNLAPSSIDGETFVDTFGFASLSISGGKILDCDITISSDVAYHGPTVYATILHELGHCLGLEDDPYSIDLDSVMSNRLIEGSNATSGDVDLITKTYNEGGLL